MEKFWSAPPQVLQPQEVVLEVAYLGVWEEPLVAGEDRVVIISCGPQPGILRYRVVRVVMGDFDDAEVLVPFGFGGISGESGGRILVGQLAKYYSQGGFNAYPPKPMEPDSGRPPSRPLFYTRSPPADHWRSDLPGIADLPHISDQAGLLPSIP